MQMGHAVEELPRQTVIESRGLRLALEDYGQDGESPLLALHGWLDNAASFARLAPLLQGCRVVAVDLPGHGHSDHRPLQGTYNIWDDLPDLVTLVEQLGHTQIRLLGHSRGAIIACLLAAVLGDRVSHLVLLDGLIPPPFEDRETPAQLRQFASDYAAQPAGSRTFDTVDHAVAARMRATGSADEVVRPIVLRNIEEAPNGEGWRWRTDPRLRLASALKLTAPQIAAVFDSISARSLLVLAEQGLAARLDLAFVRTHFPALRIERIAGEHHCHMLDQAGQIAEWINAFLAEG